MSPLLEILLSIWWIALTTLVFMFVLNSKWYKKQEKIRNRQVSVFDTAEVLGHPGCFYIFLGLLPAAALGLHGLVRLVWPLLFR
jgi:hypothetical protein